MQRGLQKGLHKVKCRICKKEVNYQGYKNHIKAQHPVEDCGDLKPYNQPSLFGQGWLKRKDRGEEEEEDEEETEETEEKEEEEKEDEEQEEEEKRDHDDEEKEQGEGEIHQGAGELKTEHVDMSLDETAEEANTVADTEEGMEAETEDEFVDAKAVNERLRQILNKLESGIDDDGRKTEVEKLNRFLDIVEKRLDIKTDVNSLVNKLEDLKMIQREDKSNIKFINVNEDDSIKVARSMQEITEKVPVFEHHGDRQQVSCIS